MLPLLAASTPKEMNDAGYPWAELIFGKTICLSLLSESVIIGCQ